MTTPATMNSLIADLRERFDKACKQVKETEKSNDNYSYGSGYEQGYADALGETLELITGDDAEAMEA